MLIYKKRHTSIKTHYILCYRIFYGSWNMVFETEVLKYCEIITLAIRNINVYRFEYFNTNCFLKKKKESYREYLGK